MSTETGIRVFENQEFQLRVTPAGDSFRVDAPGLARALGFRESHDLVRSVPDGEKGSELVRTPGGLQNVTYVTEPGFYRAMGQRQAARIKSADVRQKVTRFQDWVYGEVLPAIRKTGSYVSAAAPVPALNSPEGILALASAYHQAAQLLVGAEQRVAELEPAAEAWEVLAEGTGNYSLREAAAILTQDPAINIGQNRLMTFIRDEGMVDVKGRPYAKHNAHLVQRPVSYNHPRTNEPVLTVQLRVTPDGIAYLRRRLGGVRQEAA